MACKSGLCKAGTCQPTEGVCNDLVGCTEGRCWQVECSGGIENGCEYSEKRSYTVGEDTVDLILKGTVECNPYEFNPAGEAGSCLGTCGGGLRWSERHPVSLR